MVAAFLRLPPADGTDRAIGAPVHPGAAVGGTGEPLDGGQLTGQALAVDGSAGGGGFRHGRSVVPKVEIANCVNLPVFSKLPNPFSLWRLRLNARVPMRKVFHVGISHL